MMRAYLAEYGSKPGMTRHIAVELSRALLVCYECKHENAFIGRGIKSNPRERAGAVN